MKDIQYKTISQCRSCQSKNLTDLFSLGNQYVSDFVTKDKVYAGTRCPIDLVLCTECTLVQQRHTAPQDLLYTRNYWYKSGTTDTMRRALADVVDSAMNCVKLAPGDIVLDIGSNDGTLLRQYPTMLNLTTVGVEPATNLLESGSKNISHHIYDFWSYESYEAVMGNRRAKIITACGMFYDLDDPNKFIADIKKALAPNGIFVAQLMCLKQTIQNCDIGNFAHEHLEFYSVESLIKLFERHGLVLVDIDENNINGGSYRLFIRHKYTTSSYEYPQVQLALAVDKEMGLDKVETYTKFACDLHDMKIELYKFITEKWRKDKSIWVYGASTKGNVILQYCELDRGMLMCAVDKDIAKHDLYSIGTGLRIVSEDKFRKYCPHYALVLPYAFLSEFVNRERAWQEKGGKFIVPLPKFKVV